MASTTRTSRRFSARTSRSVLLAACLTVAGLLPGTASAEAERGTLVVEGQGGSTVTFDVEQEVLFGQPFPELFGGRSHAAVLVEPVAVPDFGGRQVTFGAVRVQAFADETSEARASIGVAERMREGRYRISLLGDGPVRAVYQLRDREAPGIRVVPRTRLRTQFFGRAERLLDGRSRAEVALPDVVPAGARVIQVGLTVGTSVDDYRMCQTNERRCKGNPLPACPPLLPCGDDRLPTPRVGGDPSLWALLHQPQATRSGLHWSVDGFREEEGRLRAAAIVF